MDALHNLKIGGWPIFQLIECMIHFVRASLHELRIGICIRPCLNFHIRSYSMTPLLFSYVNVCFLRRQHEVLFTDCRWRNCPIEYYLVTSRCCPTNIIAAHIDDTSTSVVNARETILILRFGNFFNKNMDM